MAAPISLDLRRSIVAAWRRKKLSTSELADLFGVGTATIKRLKRTVRETGAVLPRPHGGGAARIIGAAQEAVVEALVQRHPDWREDDFAKALAQQGIAASAVTVGRAIRRLGYSVKKRRSSPRNVTGLTCANDDGSISNESKTSPFRVWFLWTKPARTHR